MANIIDLAKSVFTNDVISRVSATLGENESNVNKAFNGAIPAILAGLLKKGGSDAGLSSLVNGASELTGNASLTDSLLGSLTGDNNSSWAAKGVALLQRLFGDRLGNITNMLSGFSGIKESSASSILSMAMPVILSLIGRNGGNDEKSITGFLNGQKENILGAVPSGLNLSSALGLGSLSELSSGIASAAFSGGARPDVSHQAATSPQYSGSDRKGGGGWLWILLLALAGLLVWYLLKDGCNKDKGAGHDVTVDTAHHDTALSTTTTTEVTTRTLQKVTLNDRVQLDAYPGGIEDSLIAFIKSDAYKNATEDQLKNRWFNFDDLNFEFGTTKLTAESERQLNNIAAILKAFPDVNIKVGGYTDKKGDDAANLKLSDERAKAVKAALDAKGVGSQVAGAEGYGEQFATVAESASDEERLADRRTSVRLVKK